MRPNALLTIVLFAATVVWAWPQPALAATPTTPQELDLALKLPDAYHFNGGNYSVDKDHGPLLAFTAQGSDHSIVWVEVDPRDGRSLDAFAHFPNVFDAPLLATSSPTTICNGTQPALLVIDDRNEKMHSRSIAAVSNEHAVVVQYTREKTAADDPAVLAAFAAMCLK